MSDLPSRNRSQSPRAASAPLALFMSRAGEKGARPPIFYGWVMLAVTTVTTMATSPGQSFIVGVFSDPIRQDLGISLEGFSAAYMIATFCASLPLTLVGRLGDRFGTRLMTTLVATLLGAACIFIGGATAVASGFELGERGRHALMIVVLTVSFFFLRFLGQGSLGLVSSHALAMWFERRLGFVESIRHMGMPVVVAFLPALLLLMIDQHGWRFTYAALGIIVWILVLPLAWLAFVNRPEDLNQHIDGGTKGHASAGRGRVDVELDAPSIGEAGDAHEARKNGADSAGVPYAPEFALGSVQEFTLKEAMRTRSYWIVTASMVLSAAVGTAFMFHAQPMMEDLGLSRGSAAAAVGTLGVVTLIVTIPFGHLVDRFEPGKLLAATGLMLGSACASYGLAIHFEHLRLGSLSGPILAAHLAYLLLGLSQGMLFVLASPIFARFYGRRHHGAIRGSLNTFMVIGTSAGPFVFAAWRKFSGDFSQVYLVSGALSIMLAIWATRLKRPLLENAGAA